MIDAATILVADDNPDDVELLKRAFRKAGLQNPVQFASDGTEVISYLQQEKGDGSCPLLMFLDLNMPRCNGFAVLNWLHQQPQLQNLPTIVLSNSDQRSDIDQSLRLGAHGYWVKPSRFEDLVKMIVRLKEILGKVTQKIERESPVPVAA